MTILTSEEQEADNLILEAFAAIKNMGNDKLRYNNEELAEAIHVLQSFVKQHVLHRLDPEWYGKWWYTDAEWAVMEPNGQTR